MNFGNYHRLRPGQVASLSLDTGGGQFDRQVSRHFLTLTGGAHCGGVFVLSNHDACTHSAALVRTAKIPLIPHLLFLAADRTSSARINRGSRRYQYVVNSIFPVEEQRQMDSGRSSSAKRYRPSFAATAKCISMPSSSSSGQTAVRKLISLQPSRPLKFCRSELWYFRNLPFANHSVVFVQTTRVCAINKIRRETASLSNCALDFVKEL